MKTELIRVAVATSLIVTSAAHAASIEVLQQPEGAVDGVIDRMEETRLQFIGNTPEDPTGLSGTVREASQLEVSESSVRLSAQIESSVTGRDATLGTSAILMVGDPLTSSVSRFVFRFDEPVAFSLDANGDILDEPGGAGVRLFRVDETTAEGEEQIFEVTVIPFGTGGRSGDRFTFGVDGAFVVDTTSMSLTAEEAQARAREALAAEGVDATVDFLTRGFDESDIVIEGVLAPGTYAIETFTWVGSDLSSPNLGIGTLEFSASLIGDVTPPTPNPVPSPSAAALGLAAGIMLLARRRS